LSISPRKSITILKELATDLYLQKSFFLDLLSSPSLSLGNNIVLTIDNPRTSTIGLNGR